MNATLHHSGSPASAIVLPANFTLELIGKQIPITSGTLDSTAYGPGSSEWILARIVSIATRYLSTENVIPILLTTFTRSASYKIRPVL